LNGSMPDPQVPLAAGDTLVYDAGDIPEPPVDDSFTVLADDAALMVVNKSGNVPCHPGGRYFNHTLWRLLKTRGGLDEPIFVNRLDRETSGVVLVAKSTEAAQKLSRQFAKHSVVKRYTVFVEGLFPERMDAAGWLMHDPDSVIRKKRRFVASAPGERPADAPAEWAETVFERVLFHNGFSVLTATPRTGRLHQIRATLYSLGFPVVGDKVYGLDETFFLRFCKDALTEADRQALRMRRQALHAAYLRFLHPLSGESTELVAPMPADMSALLPQQTNS